MAAMPPDPPSRDDIRRRLSNVRTYAVLLMILAFSGQVVLRDGLRHGRPAWSAAIFVACTLLMIVTCAVYARAKGRSPWLGLLGIAGCIGFVILLSLARQCHHCGRKVDNADAVCAACGAPV